MVKVWGFRMCVLEYGGIPFGGPQVFWGPNCMDTIMYD